MNDQKTNNNNSPSEDIIDYNSIPLNTENLKSILLQGSDVLMRQIYIGNNKHFPVTIFYVDGLHDKNTIGEGIIKPLYSGESLKQAQSEKEVIDLIEHGAVYTPTQKTLYNTKDVVDYVFKGFTVVIFDNEKTGLCFDTKDFERRSITEPSEENVIKGGKDSFVETLNTNKATIRKRLNNPNLRFKDIVLGKQTNTDICIVYIENLTNQKLVDEIEQRINQIDVDSVLSPGYIEEYIVDDNITIFPQVATTERPDKYCAGLVSGQVGIIIDGMPIAYLAPGIFNNFLQASEDYSTNYVVSSLIRLLRYTLVLITLLVPSFYIAVTTFHHEMIPEGLAYSISASKKGVPFPVFVEILLMLFAFEILVEAGIRLPKVIGQTISVVGALIVGQSAVEAKIVSPIVVIVIATTAIASFSMPTRDFSNALRVWRIILVIISSVLGIYGLIIGMILLLHHLCKIEVLGVPYLYPFVAGEGKQLEDSIIRLPLKRHKDRPYPLKTTNKKRQN